MLRSEVIALLNERFCIEAAEAWDNVGMIVSKADAEVTGIATALDASQESVSAARAQKANLLVTHHPPFLDAPKKIVDGPGNDVYAVSSVIASMAFDVSLAAYHTNLDKSILAKRYLASCMDMPLAAEAISGEYGMLLDASCDFHDLVKRLEQTFHTRPQIYGTHPHAVSVVGFISGSANGLIRELSMPHTSKFCLVVGEMSYHQMQEACARSICIIALGHAASERPYAGLLADVIRELAPQHKVSNLEVTGKTCTHMS